MSRKRHEKKGPRGQCVPGLEDGILMQLACWGHQPIFKVPWPADLHKLISLWPQYSKAVTAWYNSPNADDKSPIRYEGPFQAGRWAPPPFMKLWSMATDISNGDGIPYKPTEPITGEIPSWALRLTAPDTARRMEGADESARSFWCFWSALWYPSVIGRLPLTAAVIARLVEIGRWPRNWQEIPNQDLAVIIQKMSRKKAA